jgi:thiol-disulfide isomerase/thioredoxin
MNNRVVVSLVLICTLSLCCAPKPDLEGPVKVKIEGNVDPNTLAVVTLRLKGDTLPGTPKVVSADDTSGALFERVGSSEYVQQVTEDKWVAILTPGQSYVIGWIVEDNKLFGYCSEPFVAEKNIEVTFSPGMPLSLEYDLTKPEEDVTTFPAYFLLSRKADKNGSTALISWGISERIEEPKVIKIDGLAEGTYLLFAQAVQGEEFINSRTPFLYDRRFIDISASKANRFEARFPVFDTTVEDGDVTVRGRVHNSAGEILPGEKLRLVPYGSDKYPTLNLYYPDAVSDSNGYFKFKGIRPGISAVIQCIGATSDLQKSVMTKNASLWVDFLTGALSLQLYTGYAMPEFAVDWIDGQSRTGTLLGDMYGKIAVVNAGSSWCGPCQKSLAEFNQLAQEFKNNDDIVFVEMSVDASREAWEDEVKKSGLNSIQHCWYDLKNKFAFNRVIPYYMVIDKQGILRAQGNSLDIRAELKKVLESSE